ncbi:MAG: cyclomaltodextrinase C-terminal domain-containing protein, partial [Balneolales bacterium]|nr:cyclomaltodextrinase C-terminal domain-containing protein [Balneolales bacterium]
RLHEKQNVMVIMNSNEDTATIPRDVLSEILDHYKTGTNIIDGSTINVLQDFEAPGKTTSIWELE